MPSPPFSSDFPELRTHFDALYDLINASQGGDAGRPLLDIGSGAGSALAAVVAGTRSSGVALDRLRPTTWRGPARFPFVQADAGALPFATAKFSVSLIMETVEWLADPLGALSEMARVTRGPLLIVQTDWHSLWFASGDPGSQVNWYDMGHDTQLVTALLGWDHGQTSAAFAWSDVPDAPSGTMSLYDVDLTAYSPEPIQFISYEKDHWSVAERASFSVLGQYVFSHQFVPAPGAVALLAIAGLVGRRKRRL